jgi:trans-2,3-dihydro-3-hydroxyanthranilate isomerase
MKQGVMRHRFFICDVFTDTRFGGNQLAVLPDAAGLSDHQMQQITRGFNFAETTFVLPPESGHSRRVRIFTPACEVPFAGHPNVGTAAMLAAHGELGEFGESLQVTFEETAGPVPITIRRRPDGRFWCELAAPEALSLGATVPVPAPKMRHVTGRVQHHELDIAGNLVHWWHTKQKSE